MRLVRGAATLTSGLVTLGIGLALLTGQAWAATSPAAPADCGSDGWRHTGDAIGDFSSPWLDTAKGLDFSRSIQFRALSGETAQQCATGRNARFYGASQYRVKSCLKPTACQLTGWIMATQRTKGPGAGHRFPDQAVGWDQYYNIFRPYKLVIGPPRG